MDPFIPFAAFVLLIAAYVKGATGMGFPLLATPILAFLIDIRIAIALLLIPNILMDLIQIIRGRLLSSQFRRLSPLLLCGVIGVFLGTRVLVSVPLAAVNLVLGLIVLSFVLSSALDLSPSIPSSWEALFGALVGLTGGFLNGMTNIFSPLAVVYLYGLKLTKVEFIKALASIFFTMKLSQLIALSRWQLLTTALVGQSLLLTVFVMLGFFAGLKTQDRLNQRAFNRAILVLLFLMGLGLIVKALLY